MDRGMNGWMDGWSRVERGQQSSNKHKKKARSLKQISQGTQVLHNKEGGGNTEKLSNQSGGKSPVGRVQLGWISAPVHNHCVVPFHLPQSESGSHDCSCLT